MPEAPRMADSLARAILTPATAESLHLDTLLTDSTQRDSTTTDTLVSHRKEPIP